MNGLHFLTTVNTADTTISPISIAIVIVLAVLAIVWAMRGSSSNGVTETESAEVAPQPKAPAPAPKPAASTTSADEGELIAVITAAIAAMLNQPTTAFRVVSFHRNGGTGKPWNAGQTE